MVRYYLKHVLLTMSLFDCIPEFLRDDTVVLFGMTTILFFGQVSIEVTYQMLVVVFYHALKKILLIPTDYNSAPIVQTF